MALANDTIGDTMAVLQRSLSILVAGDPKVGKSTFAATAPAPRLYLDIEGGTRFLGIKPTLWDPMREDPPVYDGTWDTAVVVVRDWDTVQRTYQWLNSGRHPFTSLIVDSISELQQKLISLVSANGQASQQQWGDVLRQFTTLLRDFRDLTTHPIKPLEAIVLVAMAKDDGEGRKTLWLQGQSATVVPYFFDVAAFQTVVNWRDEEGNPQRAYRLMIGPNDHFKTGERVGGRLPAWMDSPNVETMLDFVFGKREPAPATATEEG
jgi:hypothetical protein